MNFVKWSIIRRISVSGGQTLTQGCKDLKLAKNITSRTWRLYIYAGDVWKFSGMDEIVPKQYFWKLNEVDVYNRRNRKLIKKTKKRVRYSLKSFPNKLKIYSMYFANICSIIMFKIQSKDN